MRTSCRSTENFLKSGVVSIDIFALSNGGSQDRALPAGPQSELQTTFAVGEEAEMKTTGESAGVGGSGYGAA